MQDCAEADQRIVRQHDDVERRDGERTQRGLPGQDQMRAPVAVFRLAHELAHAIEQRRLQEYGGDLPYRQGAERIRWPSCAAPRRGHARQQPRRDLPVAAYPTVAPTHHDGVSRRMVLDEIDIIHQRRPRITAFQEVVAQNEIFGHAPVHRLTKGVDVVNALADEAAFAEQILVDVRHFARIGIDNHFAREQSRKARARRGGETNGHARLQDRITFDDAAAPGVVNGTIERVRHVADERTRGVARQLGIGVQGDDIADIREHGTVADNLAERRLSLARYCAQQRVELLELAAFALIAHPYAFVRIPQTRTVEEIKDAGAVVPISCVECINSLAREREQSLVIRLIARRRSAEIGEQREIEPGIAIAEIAYLQRIDQGGNILWRAQQGGHDHHGGVFAGYALRKIHARQSARRYQQRDDAIHERHCERGDADHARACEQKISYAEGQRRLQRADHHCREADGEREDGAEIEYEPVAPHDAARAHGP